MEQLFAFVRENMDLFVLYGTAFNILALFIIITQGYRISKLNRRCSNLARNIEGKNIEEIINQYYEKIDYMDIRMNKMDVQTSKIEGKLLNCVQKVGIVRFNAFDDVGGELSFSLSLLDEQHNGIILTSIYSRSNNALYSKAVKKGKASGTLSVEELQALDRAKNNTLDEYAKMIS